MSRLNHNPDCADNIYVDIPIVNNNDNKWVVANYNSTRSQPYLSNASEYYLAVARFDIPNNNIPLFTFLDNYNSITMVNGAAQSQRYVQYISSSTLNKGVYTIQAFLDMINTTINLCCADVGIPANEAPLVWLNQDRRVQVFSFSDNANWLGGQSATWQLWMNWNIFYFFQSLQVYANGEFNPPDGKSYLVLVKDNYNGNYSAGPISATALNYNMTQESSLLQLYVTIKSIILATTSIPVNPENISYNGNASTASGVSISNSQTFNIIADFIPGQSAFYSDNFTPYVYRPPFYRLIDLVSNQPLNKLDFQIYYTDDVGQIYPLMLNPKQSVTIKLIFIKKSLAKYNQ